MIGQGYASVTNRRVATAAGVKPATVQYYFPTMDALFLAVYRRAADQVGRRQDEALKSDRPLQALWELNVDGARAVLAIEFMALANHRKEIRAEIARYSERTREQQVDALVQLDPKFADTAGPFPAAGISLLLAGAARALIMEQGLGISCGHAEARAIVERLLEQI